MGGHTEIVCLNEYWMPFNESNQFGKI